MNRQTPLRRRRAPAVSVLMPVYNNETYLAAAIESILAQSFRDFEFIISVDRESTDRSLEIVDQYARQDARLIRRLVPRSRIGGNLNHVIPQARGNYIALMEADDLALPNRLQLQFEWMETNPVDICGGAQKLFGTHNVIRWFPETHAGIRSELFFRCALHPSCVMVKTDVLQRHLFDPDVLWQDYELWTRMIPHQIFASLPHILAKIRTHERQTSVQYFREMVRDNERLRRRYVDSCFPDAAEKTRQAYFRLNDQTPFTDLALLAEAGAFLTRIADIPETAVRRRMAMRWYDACLRSAALGIDVVHLFQQVHPLFRVDQTADLAQLQAACRDAR